MANHQEITANPAQAQKLLKSYVTGFILSVALALLAYFLVVKHALSNQALYITVTAFIVLSVLVQVIFLFRLNMRTEDDRWNFICFIFTMIIMAIVVSGSLWIMYNLNYYMVNS